MMRGGHGPTRQLQDLNWGAFNQASHAPQLGSCSLYEMITTSLVAPLYIIMVKGHYVCK